MLIFTNENVDALLYVVSVIDIMKIVTSLSHFAEGHVIIGKCPATQITLNYVSEGVSTRASTVSHTSMTNTRIGDGQGMENRCLVKSRSRNQQSLLIL